MTRYKATPEGRLPLTPEEEALADIEELEWNSSQFPRAKNRKKQQLEKQYEKQLAIIIPDAAKRELIEVIQFMWKNILPAVRDPQPKLTEIITLYGKYQQARTDIDALTTVEDVIAFDVVAALT